MVFHMLIMFCVSIQYGLNNNGGFMQSRYLLSESNSLVRYNRYGYFFITLLFI